MIRSEQLERIQLRDIDARELGPGADRVTVRETEDGARASMFADGSAFFATLR